MKQKTLSGISNAAIPQEMPLFMKKYEQQRSNFSKIKQISDYFLFYCGAESGRFKMNSAELLFAQPKYVKAETKEDLYNYTLLSTIAKLITQCGLTVEQWFASVSSNNNDIFYNEFSANLLDICVTCQNAFIRECDIRRVFTYITGNSERISFERRDVSLAFRKMRLTPDKALRLNETARMIEILQEPLIIYHLTLFDFRCKIPNNMNNMNDLYIGIAEFEQLITLVIQFYQKIMYSTKGSDPDNVIFAIRNNNNNHHHHNNSNNNSNNHSSDSYDENDDEDYDHFHHHHGSSSSSLPTPKHQLNSPKRRMMKSPKHSHNNNHHHNSTPNSRANTPSNKNKSKLPDILVIHHPEDNNNNSNGSLFSPTHNNNNNNNNHRPTTATTNNNNNNNHRPTTATNHHNNSNNNHNNNVDDRNVYERNEHQLTITEHFLCDNLRLTKAMKHLSDSFTLQQQHDRRTRLSMYMPVKSSSSSLPSSPLPQTNNNHNNNHHNNNAQLPSLFTNKPDIHHLSSSPLSTTHNTTYSSHSHSHGHSHSHSRSHTPTKRSPSSSLHHHNKKHITAAPTIIGPHDEVIQPVEKLFQFHIQQQQERVGRSHSSNNNNNNRELHSALTSTYDDLPEEFSMHG
jgi:hypothetical protein